MAAPPKAGWSWALPITLAQNLDAPVAGHPCCVRPGDLTDKANADLSDVRFTTADGTEVPYCIESRLITAPVIHARYDLAAGASGTVQGYLYVGNPAASDAQDAAGVFAGYTAVWTFGDAGPIYAYDLTGNGYTLTQSGGVTFGVSGKVDGSVSFDGVNDKLVATSDLIGVGGVTTSFWFKMDGWGGGGLGRIVDNTKFLLFPSQTTFALRFTSNGANTIDSDSVLSLGVWFHGAVSRAGDGYASLFVDGALSGGLGRFSGTPATGSAVCVGGRTGDNARQFYGIIDCLRIHPTTLTASAIAAEYHSGYGDLFTPGAWEALGGVAAARLGGQLGPRVYVPQPGRPFVLGRRH